MSEYKDLPAGLIARSALPMIRDYAEGKTRDEMDAKAFLSAIAEKTKAEAGAEKLEEILSETGFGIAAWLNLWALGFEIFRAIFGRDLVCQMLIVNDLQKPLRLELPDGKLEPYQVHGVMLGRPALPTSPPRYHEIPGRAGPFCGMGLYAFHKATTLGVGTAGTSGVLQFQGIPGYLEQGLRLGWDVPFKTPSTNDCAISLGRHGSLADWFDRQLEDRHVAEDSASENGVRAWCAHNDVKGPRSLLAVLVEEES